MVYRAKALQAMSGERCIEQRAGCLPWLPHEVSVALLSHCGATRPGSKVSGLCGRLGDEIDQAAW